MESLQPSFQPMLPASAALRRCTVRALDLCRGPIAELVSEHGGRIFGSAGDGLVAEFPSPVQAVRCSVEIQRRLFTLSEDLPPDRRLEFRIGVNLGDVVVSGDDLLGDGVNVAARLQEIAAPSGICISASVSLSFAMAAPFPRPLPSPGR
ncbi:adenylate/guanylate cyclase domain-containing protein [Sinorhizobium psoraleae]|uniref:adenylate/guanylate cyclase domain-containing protein n=1 Tax=Sinorhizobium psoraleae TaxID=520838 RepID=UPI0035E3DBC5